MNKTEARLELAKLRYALDDIPDDADIITMHASFTSGTWVQLHGNKWFLDGEPYAVAKHGGDMLERSRGSDGVKIFALEQL